MKKKVLITLTFIAVTFLVGFHSISKNDKVSLLNYSLSSLESIAGCEVSPSSSENTGYCTTLIGSTNGVCVSEGYSSQPRCSGNY